MIQRLYAWLLWQLTGHRGVRWPLVVAAERPGPDGPPPELRLDPRCRWIRHAAYEADVVRYVRSLVTDGSCVIDVGAHVGFYVLQAARWVGPEGRVIAFEPNPLARDVLSVNVRLNGFSDRVRIEGAAVGEQAGATVLYGGTDTSGLSRLRAPNAISGHRHAIDVPLVSLDVYCADQGIRPSVLIVDVEGAELTVLQGARDLLAGSDVPAVVEIHPELWGSFSTDADGIRAFATGVGRKIVPLKGQRDPLGDYGTVALLRG